MIEQPLRRGADAPLANFSSPVPLCADESCLHLGELDQAAGRYQLINIKLDKTGGLTQVTCLTLAAMFLHYASLLGSGDYLRYKIFLASRVSLNESRL
jgi:L-alanine-DL-glutamate epimerase-like enolase superfamily enzyme